MFSTINNATVQAAILPFRIIESLGIPCGYERSFKLSFQSILSNRYILGINTRDITRKQLVDTCNQLNMPYSLLEQFIEGLPDANTILLGYEEKEKGGSVYKVYLEYWDQLRKKFSNGIIPRDPHLLGKGFKWQIDNPDKHLVTLYHCLAGLEITEIKQRIEAIYQAIPDSKGLNSVREIISLALERHSGKRYLYIEVNEPGNPRKSFDLNLYPAGMRVRHVAEQVRNVALALKVPPDNLYRLMGIIENKLFGHISGGISRTGDEYFTVYYEN